jgi:hypothetical protein
MAWNSPRLSQQLRTLNRTSSTPLVPVAWKRGFCSSRLASRVEPLRGRPAMKWNVLPLMEALEGTAHRV